MSFDGELTVIVPDDLPVLTPRAAEILLEILESTTRSIPRGHRRTTNSRLFLDVNA